MTAVMLIHKSDIKRHFVAAPMSTGLLRDSGAVWEFIPEPYQLRTIIDRFEYAASRRVFQDNTQRKMSAMKVGVDNRAGKATFKVDTQIEKSVSSHASWSFYSCDETRFSNEISVSLGAGLGGIAELAGMELGGALTNSTEYKHKTQVENSTFEQNVESERIRFTAKFPIPAGEFLDVVASYEQTQLEVPFTARMRIGATVAGGKPLSYVGVRSLLQREGYQGTIIGGNAEWVEVEVDGTVQIDCCHNLNLKVRDMTDISD